MTPGTLVRYYDPNRGWHIGKLIKTGRKWAKVQHPIKGVKKVLMVNVQNWAEV